MKNIIKTMIVSFLISITYLFVVTLFFQGFGKAKYFDAIPDTLIITLGLTLLLTTISQQRQQPKRLFVLGSCVVILERLIEIPLQEYQLIQGNPIHIAWIAADFIFLIGLLILLMGFTKLYE